MKIAAKTRYNPAAEILNALFNATETGKTYTVKFKDRQPATFYEYIIDELKKDPATEWIMDNETGELIYYK